MTGYYNRLTCKHLDREEIDFYLVIPKQLRTFTQCKDCNAWLEEV